ncbi:MAG: glutaconyl-CoA decarboxylase subunit alpha, partial [Desulfotignum sp.]
MRQYFEKMPPFGKELNKGQLKNSEKNITQVQEVEAGIDAEVEKVKNAGLSEEKINARGSMTVWQRLEYLVDPGTWHPLHTIFNPEDNEEGTTNVVDGLGKIS